MKPIGIAMLVTALAGVSGQTTSRASSDKVRGGNSHSDKQSRLRLRITPTVAFAPALLKVQAEVPPAETNRRLVVSAESETYYRSTTIELDGNKARAAHYVEFGSLPVGTYEIRGKLFDDLGKLRAEVRRDAVVTE
jgi:hypothetical protein